MTHPLCMEISISLCKSRDMIRHSSKCTTKCTSLRISLPYRYGATTCHTTHTHKVVTHPGHILSQHEHKMLSSTQCPIPIAITASWTPQNVSSLSQPAGQHKMSHCYYSQLDNKKWLVSVDNTSSHTKTPQAAGLSPAGGCTFSLSGHLVAAICLRNPLMASNICSPLASWCLQPLILP